MQPSTVKSGLRWAASCPRRPGALGAGRCLIYLENLLGNDHLQLVGPGQVGVHPVLVLAVEDFLSIKVNLQPPGVGRRQLDGNIPRVLGAPELRRQPRGDSMVPSRYAVNNLHFHFPKLGTRHVAPSSARRGPRFDCCGLPSPLGRGSLALSAQFRVRSEPVEGMGLGPSPQPSPEGGRGRFPAKRG